MRAVSLLGILFLAPACGDADDPVPGTPELAAPAPEATADPARPRTPAVITGLSITRVEGRAISGDRLTWSFAAEIHSSRAGTPRFTWDFDGQGTSSSPAPTFTFTRQGLYTVLLAVEEGGATATAAVEVDAGPVRTRP